MSREEKGLVDLEVEAMLRKGTIQKVRSQGGQFLSNIFLVAKKIWGDQTCHKSKAPECLYTLPTFQNGGFAFTKRSVERETLFVLNRFEGRILLCPSPQQPEKVHQISVGGAALRISMPVFQSRPHGFSQRY